MSICELISNRLVSIGSFIHVHTIVDNHLSIYRFAAKLGFELFLSR